MRNLSIALALAMYLFGEAIDEVLRLVKALQTSDEHGHRHRRGRLATMALST